MIEQDALVERVAEAMWAAADEFITRVPWDSEAVQAGYRGEKYRRMARAALEALLDSIPQFLHLYADHLSSDNWLIAITQDHGNDNYTTRHGAGPTIHGAVEAALNGWEEQVLNGEGTDAGEG